MQTHHKVRKSLRQFNVASFIVKLSLAAVMGLFFAGTLLSANVVGAQAHSLTSCSAHDQTYSVIGGDTLGEIAFHYATSWRTLAAYNHIANPNLIYTHQVICIPGRGAVAAGGSNPTWTTAPVMSAPLPSSVAAKPGSAPVGSHNVFPYGACTWWADQRYFQLHGVFVPWTMNANAWQWTARAYEFGWRVSGRPTPGAIVDLQPWVQGAYGGGHVAVVERVLSNGHVIASSMSWAPYPWAVTVYEFVPGPGVTFINR